MSIATFERKTRSRKQSLIRACRRTLKAPVKMLFRLQGYDNSQAILLEDAIYFQIPKVASSSLKALLKKELRIQGSRLTPRVFPLLIVTNWRRDSIKTISNSVLSAIRGHESFLAIMRKSLITGATSIRHFGPNVCFMSCRNPLAQVIID